MKKAYLYAILVVFIAASVRTGSGASGVYREFTSEAGGFSVETPVRFLSAVLTDRAEPRNLRMHMFMGELGDKSYMVSYFDHPKRFVQRDPQQLLDRAVEGSLARTRSKGVRTKVVSETPLSLDGYPGREIVTDFTLAGGKRGRSKWRLFLVNDRLYTLVAGGIQGAMTDGEMDKFLDSFRLLR